MTNNKGKTETVVISATGGAVDEAAAPVGTPAQPSPARPAPTQPISTQPASTQPTSTQPTSTQSAVAVGQPEQAEVAPDKVAPDNVEYEPVVYSDPGAVTEQFDHLATRDPELMERAPEAPDAAVATGAADVPTELEREAIAMTGANELGYQNPEASSDHAADTVQELRGAGHVEGVDSSGDVAREVGAMTRSDDKI